METQLTQRGTSPIFGPRPLWPNGSYGGRPWPNRLCVTGHPAPPKSPQFSADVYCGQTARWIKIPLRTEVGLGPSDIVLDGAPAPLKGHSTPHFSAHVYSGQTAGWIKMPHSMEADLAQMGTQLPIRKQHGSPLFRPMSMVAKRSPISVSAHHLSVLTTAFSK